MDKKRALYKFQGQKQYFKNNKKKKIQPLHVSLNYQNNNNNNNNYYYY